MKNVTCHQCHQNFQVPQDGQYHCPLCGAVNNIQSSLPGDSGWEISWKSRPLLSLIETLRFILGSPVVFFRSLPVPQTYLPPLIFAILVQTIGSGISLVYQMGFAYLTPDFLAQILRGLNPQEFFTALLSPFAITGAIIFLPIAAFFGILFSTALYHFILWILGGTNRGLPGTVRAVCYSTGAQIVMLIPLIGGLIAGIWQVVLVIIGLKEVHGTSYAKSVLTVVIPFLCCCGIVVLAVGGLLSFLMPFILKYIETAGGGL